MTDAKLGRPARILLVEDNFDDVELTRAGFERARLKVDLIHAENGQECMQLLRKEGPHANAVTPDLVLLDLNMPVMDGREVLAEIVADEKLRSLPVVVLTTSESERDVLDMYRLRCSSYVRKPVDFNQLQRVVQEISSYWFQLVVLPTG